MFLFYFAKDNCFFMSASGTAAQTERHDLAANGNVAYKETASMLQVRRMMRRL